MQYSRQSAADIHLVSIVRLGLLLFRAIIAASRSIADASAYKDCWRPGCRSMGTSSSSKFSSWSLTIFPSSLRFAKHPTNMVNSNWKLCWRFIHIYQPTLVRNIRLWIQVRWECSTAASRAQLKHKSNGFIMENLSSMMMFKAVASE